MTREVVVVEGAVRGAGAVVFGAAAVGFGLLELLRVWFPSLLFVFGDAGDTSALVIAGFGAVCFAVAPLLALVPARISAAALWWSGSATLVVARATLIPEVAPLTQLAASSAGVVGATVALVALARDGRSGRDVRVGVLAGVVVATCLHLVTGTVGLVWPTTSASTAGSVLVIAVLVGASWLAGRFLATSADPGREATSPAWAWTVLVPTLLLIGTLTGVPGRTAQATGWSPAAVAGTLAGAHLLALVAAMATRWLGPVRSGALAAATILGGTLAALDASGVRNVAGQVVLVIGLGLLVGGETGVGSPRTTFRSRGVVAGSSLLVFALLCGIYYTAYDISLPFHNRLVLIAAAGHGAILAFAGLRASHRVPLPPVGRRVALPGRVVLVAVAAALVAAGARMPAVAPAGTPEPDTLRVAAYNIRFGFDVDGRFSAREQAELLRGLAPDVVVLNEVDRGWLTSGGHDALALLTATLGLPHVVFAPAADEVYGNAVLSRYPIAEHATETLPQGDDPMTRSQIAAVLDLGGQRRVGVIGTHLSHLGESADARLPQARAVAATVAVLRERGVPTVLLGDLNAEPGSAELATFDNMLTDMLPAGTATYRADDPDRHIDHVLASAEFRRREASVPAVTLSDHLPVMVELAWTAP